MRALSVFLMTNLDMLIHVKYKKQLNRIFTLNIFVTDDIDELDKCTNISRLAYEATLMKYHPWVVQVPGIVKFQFWIHFTSPAKSRPNPITLNTYKIILKLTMMKGTELSDPDADPDPESKNRSEVAIENIRFFVCFQ